MTDPWQQPPPGPPPPGFVPSYQPYAGYLQHPAYPPPLPPPAGPRNGFGTTALVCGLIGALLGIEPVTFALAAVLGVVAVVFGLLGLGRARSGEATNGKLALAGTVLGVVAMVLAVVGLVVVVNHVRHGVGKVGNYFECISNVPADDPQRELKIQQCGDQF